MRLWGKWGRGYTFFYLPCIHSYYSAQVRIADGYFSFALAAEILSELFSIVSEIQLIISIVKKGRVNSFKFR